jgi:hypothetical protein
MMANKVCECLAMIHSINPAQSGKINLLLYMVSTSEVRLAGSRGNLVDTFEVSTILSVEQLSLLPYYLIILASGIFAEHCGCPDNFNSMAPTAIVDFRIMLYPVFLGVLGICCLIHSIQKLSFTTGFNLGPSTGIKHLLQLDPCSFKSYTSGRNSNENLQTSTLFHVNFRSSA